MAGQPTNADGLRAGETDYRTLEDQLLAGVPRPLVLRLAVNVLVRCFPIDVLVCIIDEGYDKFRAVAGDVWRDHEFSEHEYKTAFDIVGLAMKDRLKALGAIH